MKGRHSVGRAIRRLFWWLLLLGLQLLVPASGAVRITFLPNYHLNSIDRLTDEVADDGHHAAVFKVQLLDHQDRFVPPGVAVDWMVEESVPGQDTTGVRVSPEPTDANSESFVRIRSRTAGTFKLIASWQTALKTSRQTSSVTFCPFTALTFPDSVVTVNLASDQQVPVQQTEGGNKMPVTYSSSQPDVADFSDSDADQLNLKNAGLTLITATETGTDRFAQQSASYVLRVIAGSGNNLTFPSEILTVTIDNQSAGQQVDNSDGAAITYASSNNQVAAVEQNTGSLTVQSTGLALITATQAPTESQAGRQGSYIVQVDPATCPTLVFDNPGPIEISFDEDPPRNLAAPTCKGSITYESDRLDVASVDNSGTVTLKGVGTARIFAKETSPNHKPSSAFYELKVSPGIGKPLTFAEDDMMMWMDDKDLHVDITSSNSGNITYKSNDTSVATVDADSGLVQPVGIGNTQIRAIEKSEKYQQQEASFALAVYKSKTNTLEIKCPDSVVMGSFLVAVAGGKPDKEIHFYANGSFLNKKTADNQGRAIFTMQAPQPSQCLLIKFKQDENVVYKNVRVKPFLNKARPTYSNGKFQTKITSKKMEFADDTSKCPSGWQDERDECYTIIDKNNFGNYDDLKVTDQYTEPLPSENQQDILVAKTSFSAQFRSKNTLQSKYQMRWFLKIEITPGNSGPPLKELPSNLNAEIRHFNSITHKEQVDLKRPINKAGSSSIDDYATERGATLFAHGFQVDNHMKLQAKEIGFIEPNSESTNRPTSESIIIRTLFKDWD